jgi:hypothetical protein
MSGASRRHRVPIAAAVAAVFALPAGLAAATAEVSTQSPQPIYAAFSLVKKGILRHQRCGVYRVTTGTYTGTSFSPDPRMAGSVTYFGRVLALPSGPTGLASGTLTIRNGKRVRMRATVSGVFTNRAVVNGMVNGALFAPNARLRANVTMIYDDALAFIVFRLGLESGANTAVAYPAVPKCS